VYVIGRETDEKTESRVMGIMLKLFIKGTKIKVGYCEDTTCSMIIQSEITEKSPRQISESWENYGYVGRDEIGLKSALIKFFT